jgi:hypothetical protein
VILRNGELGWKCGLAEATAEIAKASVHALMIGSPLPIGVRDALLAPRAGLLNYSMNKASIVPVLKVLAERPSGTKVRGFGLDSEIAVVFELDVEECSNLDKLGASEVFAQRVRQNKDVLGLHANLRGRQSTTATTLPLASNITENRLSRLFQYIQTLLSRSGVMCLGG